MNPHNQALPSEAIHLPDSIEPDEGPCALQDADLTTPGLDLLPGWSSGLPDSDVLSPPSGLDVWGPLNYPDDLSLMGCLGLLEAEWEQA